MSSNSGSLFVGSIDQGTQSTRFSIFDQRGRIVASAQESFDLIHPQPGYVVIIYVFFQTFIFRFVFNVEHILVFCRKSWAEQDPAVLLSTVTNCMEKARKAASETEKSFTLDRLKAIGVTNQRETIIVWDRASGKPLHNAVVWLDTRTSAIVQTVAGELGGVDALRTRCGLPIATYFSAVKLRWLYENVESVRVAFDNGTCLVGTVDSWIIWVRLFRS